jgi:tetratricopeptide (TPR) repeat protein
LELAQSYITARKYDEAVKEYVDAFKVSYQASRIEEALRIYDMAFTLKPDNLILSQDMEFQVAMQCTKHAHYELGYLILQKLHRLKPNHPKTEQILAKLISLCSNKLGQQAEAYEYYQELENKYPRSRYIEILQWEMDKIKDRLDVPSQETPS